MLFSINYFRYIAAINHSQIFLSTIDGWLNLVTTEYDTLHSIIKQEMRYISHRRMGLISLFNLIQVKITL